MKALKHSPEWAGPLKKFTNKDGTEITFTPFSRRTTLHVHVKGRTKEGKFIEGYYGNGDETLFVNLGNKAQLDANGQAKLIHDNFIVAPKMKEELEII